MRFIVKIIFFLITIIGYCATCYAQNSNQNKAEKIFLSSGYITSIHESFIVEQDDLYRIINILEKYQKISSIDSMLVYHVLRKDKRFYETTNIDDVFLDPNIENKEIIQLIIELRIIDTEQLRFPKSETYITKIDFNNISKAKITMSVLGNDRGWALKLSDDLEPQIKRVINNKKTPFWLIIVIILFIFDMIETIKFKYVKNIRIRNFIDMFSNSTFVGFLVIWLVLNHLFFKEYEILIKLFGPVSGFAWGEFKKVITELETTRNNVFWGIIVALAVSVISNFWGPLALYNKKTDKEKSNK